MKEEKKSWKFIDNKIKPILYALSGSTEKSIKEFLQDLKSDKSKEDLRKKIAIALETPDHESTKKLVDNKFRSFCTSKLNESKQTCSSGGLRVNRAPPEGKGTQQTCSSGPSRNRAPSDRTENRETRIEKEKWSQLKLSTEFPLHFVNSGEEAKPIDAKAPSLAAEKGYHICNAHELFKTMERVADDSLLQVTFIVHELTAKEVNMLETQILDKIRTRASNQEHPISLNPGIDECDLHFSDKQRRPCTLVHMDKDDKILPKTQGMAKVTFGDKDTATLQVSIIEPICRELGIAAWFKELTLAEGKYEAYRRAITKNFTELTKLTPKPPSVKRNTQLRWRGEEITGGRITAFFDVPQDRLQEFLAKSGDCGTIIDMPGAEENKKFDYVKVKFPPNHTMRQALDKIQALPPALKAQTKGIVPTFKGYAVRVPRTAEAEITAALDPELAGVMHRALGMQHPKKWKLTGIPRHVSPGRVHSTLATQNAEWSGWIVRPIKTLGNPRDGKCDWLVEATQDPPKNILIVSQKDIVVIEKYEDMQKVPSRLRGWEKIFVDKSSQPKSSWSDSKPAATTIHHDIAHDETKSREIVDSITQHNSAMDTDTKQTASGMEVDAEGEKLAENKKKRGPPPNDSESKDNNENQLITLFREQSERAQKQIELKDEQIKTLMAQIDTLTREVKALREDVRAVKTPVGTEKDEHL